MGNSTPEQRAKQPKKFVYPKFDPNKVNERVNQLNFAGNIPDEILSKAVGEIWQLLEMF